MAGIKEKLLMVKEKISDLHLLYVEDNEGLRDNMEKLLSQVFSFYCLAEDGEEGLKYFKEGKYSIIITDINMPKMNGLQMIKEIKKIDPFVKVLIASAQTDENSLFEAIEAGVFRYLKKPLKLDELVEALHDIVLMNEAEENYILFENQLKDVFNYQNQLILMFKKDQVLLANQSFLKFFDENNIATYLEHNPDISALVEKEEGFLHTTSESSWYEYARHRVGKLFHVQLLNRNKQKRHMILKVSEVPDKEDYLIVTFDDVTDLNLMPLLSAMASNKDNVGRHIEGHLEGEIEGDIEGDYDSAIKMMNIVFENKAELKLYNYYKGLAIINKASIISIEEDNVVVKTSYSQLKIIEISKYMTIGSEAFPTDIVCKEVGRVDYDKQTVSFNKFEFMLHSASERQNQRLEPQVNDSISLFYHESKFLGKVKIVDLSIVSLKMELNALPIGMKKGDMIKISLVLSSDKHPLLITTEAKVDKLYDSDYKFYAIVIFELSKAFEEKLSHYLNQRQLALIKEFKNLIPG